jgi:hypothetical protein
VGSIMAQQNEVLLGAIRKLAVAGEKAGFTVEEMIELLNTGVSIDTLLNLICFRFETSDYCSAQTPNQIPSRTA